MKIKLFSLSPKGELSVNTHEVLGIESFRTIINRDKSRDKLKAFKELTYIYLTVDFNSPLVKQGLSEAKIRKEAIDKVELPKGWKEDDVIKRAAKDYDDLQEDVARRTIKDILDLFANYSKIIKKIKTSLDKLLDDKTDITNDQARDALNLIRTTLTVAKEIPGEIINLKESVRELESESYIEDRDKLRGTDDVVPSSANPHEDY